MFFQEVLPRALRLNYPKFPDSCFELRRSGPRLRRERRTGGKTIHTSKWQNGLHFQTARAAAIPSASAPALPVLKICGDLPLSLTIARSYML